MLTTDKYKTAAAIAGTDDNSSAVVAEYITMPKSIRTAVTDQVRADMQAAGLTMEEYVAQNRKALRAMAEKNTMSLTTLVAFLMDRQEEDAAAGTEAHP